MKKVLTFLLIFFLTLLAIAVLAGVGFAMVYLLKWPWWLSISVISGAVGFFVFAIFLKRYLTRRNEKKFVKRIIDEGDAQTLSPDAEQNNFNDLQSHFLASVDKLRKSNLKKHGNPLYVLPWYMVIGESRSGKTSAIKNARLSSPLTDVVKSSTAAGTQNCDWWFFNEGIILDTAGRYTIPIHEAADKKEWGKFLSLVSRFRKKEPINGIIAVISADKLQQDDHTSLRDAGQQIRQRLNHVMRVLGANIPVYIMVTKMDLVFGFTSFFDRFSSPRADEVMGFLNTNDEARLSEIISDTFSTISKTLDKIRFIGAREGSPSAEVLFPKEFTKLSPGLKTFAEAIFSEDVYQTTPMFRGIYFSSACRDGIPMSDFTNKTGIQEPKPLTTPLTDGIFLKGFFQTILPADRHRFKVLSEYLSWRRMTRSMGLMASLFLSVFACGLITYSFYKNINALDNFKTMYKAPAKSTGDLSVSVLNLHTLRQNIQQMNQINSGWIWPRLGFDQSLEIVNDMTAQYEMTVAQELLSPLEKQLNARDRGELKQSELSTAAGFYIIHIHMVQAQLSGSAYPSTLNADRLLKLILPKLSKSLVPEVSEQYIEVVNSYLNWEASDAELEAYQQRLQLDLQKLIASDTSNLSWLSQEWISNVKPISITHYIGGGEIKALENHPTVSGAFTPQGKKKIQNFISNLKTALPKTADIKTQEAAFWENYTRQYINEWYAFTMAFPKGADWQHLHPQWASLAQDMISSQNPYFTFLTEMDTSLADLKITNPPQWIVFLHQLMEAKKQAGTIEAESKGSIIAKLEQKKEDIKKTSYEAVDKAKVIEIQYIKSLSKPWLEYRKSLADMVSTLSYSSRCYQMFKSFFSTEDSQGGDSPFVKSSDAFITLKSQAKEKDRIPMLWDMVAGPFEYMIAYGAEQSGNEIQSLWEQQVLSLLPEADPDKIDDLLFDKTQGAVWKFVTDSVGPFIEQSPSGYKPRRAYNTEVSFTQSFINYLNRGSALVLKQRKNYTATLNTLPLDVNDEAKTEPFNATLTLACAKEKTSLVNANYPQSQEFKWSPDTCGDTVLSIGFKGFTLSKTYPGQMGFAHFLNDFKSGKRDFSPTDFPGSAAHLINLGISNITVSYEMSDISPILELLNRKPEKSPEKIILTRQTFYSKPETQKPETTKKPKSDLSNQIVNVRIDTLPTQVNSKAKIKPYSVIFSIVCPEGPVWLENNNYPSSVDFKLIDGCGVVTLIIRFPKIILTKEYDDFADFFKLFKSGSHTFTTEDFPEFKDKLVANNISDITVSYKISGATPVLQQTKAKKPSLKAPPKKAAAQPATTPAKKQTPDEKPVYNVKWMNKQKPDFFTIQILSTSNKQKATETAKGVAIPSPVAVIESKLKNDTVFIIVQGVYASYSEASNHLKMLPDNIKKGKPWIRRFKSVLKDAVVRPKTDS